MSLGINLYLDACARCGRPRECVYGANLTHNLGPMWRAAGLPFSPRSARNTAHGKRIAEVLPAIEAGLATLRAEPERFRAMNPPNGFGTYDELCAELARMIEAARRYPVAFLEFD